MREICKIEIILLMLMDEDFDIHNIILFILCSTQLADFRKVEIEEIGIIINLDLFLVVTSGKYIRERNTLETAFNIIIDSCKLKYLLLN